MHCVHVRSFDHLLAYAGQGQDHMPDHELPRLDGRFNELLKYPKQTEACETNVKKVNTSFRARCLAVGFITPFSTTCITEIGICLLSILINEYTRTAHYSSYWENIRYIDTIHLSSYALL